MADAAAFEASYDELRRVAYRAAFRLLGDRDAAEDIAAETLTRAYSRWSSVREHALPWVVRVASNLALDRGRSLARTSGRQMLIDQATPDPQLEERMDLQRALASLPRRQREVVVLRFLGDLSEKATAEALGIDVGTVKSHCARALARLRTSVERV
jgi:RNA polymerase sigma factor (sigma-70 family)